MPLTPKGEKIMAAMTQTYGTDRAKKVFYASRNAGKITGVDPESKDRERATRMRKTRPKSGYSTTT